MSNFHVPVMLYETVDFLNVQKDEWYFDCNLGGGGHTSEILKRGGKVIGVDLDADAIKEAAKNHNLECEMQNDSLFVYSDRLILYQENFINIDKAVNNVRSHFAKSNQNFKGIYGVLFDFGLSSHQLDTPERGFSFQTDAPLDMRMDTSKPSATASDLVNGMHEKELAEVFLKYGEESFARPIAKRIVQTRLKEKITTTMQLAKVVEKVKRREGRIHPATKIFQALRIAVNDELYSIQVALPKAIDLLEVGGRVVVISFHSLEDRIVKDFMHKTADEHKGLIVTTKPVEPTEDEVVQNPRARSAKVRVLEKI